VTRAEIAAADDERARKRACWEAARSECEAIKSAQAERRNDFAVRRFSILFRRSCDAYTTPLGALIVLSVAGACLREMAMSTRRGKQRDPRRELQATPD
jgi:hypothetical protein